MKILVSAGEASSDRYAAELVDALRERLPGAEFFGCTGPRLRKAGVRTVTPSEHLSVVGVFEVLAHAPRIYQELWRMARAAREERPAFAIVTDAPGFHIDLAKHLHRSGIPVFYYVAPQVWAWRKGRVRLLRRYVDHLLCIFPFEEKFFAEHRVPTTYVGHPLSETTHTTMSRLELFERYGFQPDRPLVAVLPGSRRAEAARHMPVLVETMARLGRGRPLNFVLPASHTTGKAFFSQRVGGSGVQIVEDDLHNVVGHADLALVASGTATVETALLGTPMVVFYRVTAPTWWVGKLIADVPFYSMVNLLAGQRIVPELIQGDCTPERLATEAARLLDDESARRRMREELLAVDETLTGKVPAAQRAAEVICEQMKWSGEPAAEPTNSLAVS